MGEIVLQKRGSPRRRKKGQLVVAACIVVVLAKISSSWMSWHKGFSFSTPPSSGGRQCGLSQHHAGTLVAPPLPLDIDGRGVLRKASRWEVEAGKVKKYELKDLLKESGLKVSGKKGDLVERLSKHLQKSDLHSWKASQLEKWLAVLGENTTGTEQVLTSRLQGYLEEEQQQEQQEEEQDEEEQEQEQEQEQEEAEQDAEDKEEDEEKRLKVWPRERFSASAASDGPGGDVDAAPRESAKRLPELNSPANPDEHVFIALESTCDEIGKLLLCDSIVYVRAGVAAGKSTLAQYLECKPGYLYVPVPMGPSYETWTAAFLMAANKHFEKKYTTVTDALKAVWEGDLTIILDEAHTIFQSRELCETFFQGDPITPAGNRAKRKILLFSSAAEALHGDMVTTPKEITGKFLWTPPVPETEKLVGPLQEAGVQLTHEAAHFFVQLSAGHRGVFMAAMRWVRKQQEMRPDDGKWTFSTAVMEVRNSMDDGWLSDGSFLHALTQSRAVRVNGNMTLTDPSMVTFAEVLFTGPQPVAADLRRRLCIKGFLLPARKAQPGMAQLEEFQPVDWAVETCSYRVAHPLLAQYYRKTLLPSAQFEVQIKAEYQKEATSCMDLMMRALPFLTFEEVVAFPIPDADGNLQSSLSAKNFPYEVHYTGALVRVLKELGYKGTSSENPRRGKVDTVATIETTTFAFEGIMAVASVPVHAEHLGRFSKYDHYKNASHKSLVIIGEQEQVHKRVSEMAKMGESVEIIGLIPSVSHDSYKVIVWHPSTDKIHGPVFVECDSVARCFNITAEGDAEILPVQELLTKAPAKQSAGVWVQQLQEVDGRFELTGNAFQVKGEMANVDDLKEGIKRKNPSTVKCDTREIDIYSRSDDGSWLKEPKMSAPVRQTEEENPYGFVVPPA